MKIGSGVLGEHAKFGLEKAGVNYLGELAVKALDFIFEKQELAYLFTAAEGEFKVISFEATEGLNTPYEVKVALSSKNPDIDMRKLMDQPATLGVYQKFERDIPRYFSGIVTEVERGDRGTRRTKYSVTLRPAVYRLSQIKDSRIWQKTTIPEIVKKLLVNAAVLNVDWRLTEKHDVREYITQFRETTLDFVHRILAEEGIFYFFEHSAEGHKMVLTDAPLATPVLTHAEKIRYNPYHGVRGMDDAASFLLDTVPGGSTTVSALGDTIGDISGNDGMIGDVGKATRTVSTVAKTFDAAASILGLENHVGTIGAFSQKEKLKTNMVSLNDYSFKNPIGNYKQTSLASDDNGSKGEYQHYDYPGRYKNPKGEGGRKANYRIESIRAEATVGEGVGNNIHLSPGYRFTIEGHDDARVNIQHFIVKVTHKGQQPAAVEEDAGTDPTKYFCKFQTMPGRLPYRAPEGKKPRTDGPQIAIVTGPADEEIYCDEFGRVKVWFPWDKYGERNEQSSCWIRVSQNWAGGAYGQMALPRIGNEVIVDYLDGDPDQPIVVGRTYHANNKPPYALPEHKTRMTIKSKTHKGDGSNELRFEDEAEKEEIFLHAQKDLNAVVSNDESHSVGRDQSVSISNDQIEYVGNDRKTEVTQDRNETIGRNLTQTIRGDVEYEVIENQREKYGKDHIHTVGNIHKQTIIADHLYETGRNYQGLVKGAYSMEVVESITANTPNHTLMAGEKFEIVGPGGKIVIDDSGITLEAANITLKGAVSMGGSGSSQVPTLQEAANESLPICEECEAEDGENK